MTGATVHDAGLTDRYLMVYPQGDADWVTVLSVDGDIHDDTTAVVRLPDGTIRTVLTLDLCVDQDDDLDVPDLDDRTMEREARRMDDLDDGIIWDDDH